MITELTPPVVEGSNRRYSCSFTDYDGSPITDPTKITEITLKIIDLKTHRTLMPVTSVKSSNGGTLDPSANWSYILGTNAASVRLVDSKASRETRLMILTVTFTDGVEVHGSQYEVENLNPPE